MAEVTFTISGVDTIIDRMSTLPKKLQKKAAKIAARRGMNIVRDEARKNAKRLDVRDPYGIVIWKNIRTQEATRSSRRVGGVVMRVGVAGGAVVRRRPLKQRLAESASLPGKATQHWRLLEFGSATNRATPFMRPALQSKIEAVTAKVAEELSAAIDRLAASPPGGKLMFPPVYAVCAADTSVATLLSDSDGRIRLYPGGEAPQNDPRPYAVWQTIYGEPDNSLSCTPNTDLFGTQIDVYGPTLDGVRAIASAIRDACESSMIALVVRYNGETREAGSRAERHWRISFDVEWHDYRA